jgi:carbamoylphosphate synthase large subunit
MDGIITESTGTGSTVISAEAHYKAMVAEQNAQIYKQYVRISDLIEENKILKADVVELSAKLNEVK